jgi:hypothetical protein
MIIGPNLDDLFFSLFCNSRARSNTQPGESSYYRLASKSPSFIGQSIPTQAQGVQVSLYHYYLPARDDQSTSTFLLLLFVVVVT